MNIRIGKTQINVEAEGCYRCGTRWSRRWYPIKDVPVQIGNRAISLTLNVCHDCATPKEKEIALE